MTPENILKQVEVAITNRPDSPTDTWRLILKDNKILCIPKKTHIKQEQYIRRINLEDALYGFAIPQWQLIVKRIYQIKERHKKCQRHQKPLL